MGIIHVGILTAILLFAQGGQSFKHPELVEHFQPLEYEPYVPGSRVQTTELVRGDR